MKLILHFLKPYRWICVFTILAMLLDVAGGLLVPRLTADMINIGVESRGLDYMIGKGIAMLTVTVFSGAGALLGSWLCADLSAKIGEDMRNAVYEKSLTFSAHDFEQFGTGSMITRTLNDINIIQQSVVWCIQMVLPVPAVCIMGVGMAFAIDTVMGFLLIGVTALIIVLALLVTRKASEIFGRLQRLLDRMNVVLRENLTGVRVIRAFNKEKDEEKRMRKTFEDYAETAVSANLLFAGLEKEPEIRDGEGRIDSAGNPEDKEAACPADAGWEAASFSNVTFRFPDADENALTDLNFTCRKGETTAVIGGTGSGKSTIAKLLLRFHDVTEGTVRVGGADVRDISQNELRSRISYVPQKAWLFSGTIADNLCYGKEDATEEERRRILSVAQADFVSSLANGLDAHVAQGGTNYSGGQKQRLAIARALMKKADLYIFDDSFSALDFKTDAALRKALKEEVSDAAVLIIAQRINTILNADQIVVLDEGRIAGIGRHEELMENCPVYCEIARSQMKGGGEVG